MKKKALIGTGILLIIFIVLNLTRGKKLPTVDFVVVSKGRIQSTVKAEGYIKAKNQVDISAEVTGKIIKIYVEEGDWVKKGDILLRIDPEVYKAKVKQMEAVLNADLARYRRVSSQFRRTKELREKALISDAEYEEALANYESLKATIVQDSFALKEAEENLKKTVISSPIEGEVVSINKEEGETVIMGTINQPGSVIMTIADRSEIIARTLVDESEVVNIKPGQSAEIKLDAYPDTTFEGVVTRIGGVPEVGYSTSQSELSGNSYPVEIMMKNPPEDIYIKMSAVCEIVTAWRDSALVVPLSAVGRKEVDGEMRNVLLKIEKGKVRIQPVSLGIQSLRDIEIIEGIEEGDTVMVGPYKLMRELNDGEEVKLRK